MTSTVNSKSQVSSPSALPYPELTDDQVAYLKSNGCIATDWSRIRIHPDSDLSLIRNVEFEGDVTIGLLNRSKFPRCCLREMLICDSTIADGARLRYITGGLKKVTLGKEVEIENTYLVEFTPDADCGVGLRVAVLDETGSREVILFPGLSAQTAMLMARGRRKDAQNLYTSIQDHINSGDFRLHPAIGDRSRILNCGSLIDVSIGHDIDIEGASALKNGAVINNAPDGKGLAFVGPGVDADGFIIEDGKATSGTLLRNVYIGQGAVLEKGFTAHDSLFFANCSMENGEACALFAGPYSVSMHKGTLLIGCQTSFMNAGSSTNQSNHMYKLGPIHWGILERGVKTSSGSYLMLGANIGAFSLLMGQHKTHPDSREFPFSYLFGDAQGATVVVPGVMLRSCGLLRDEQKWPARDRRKSVKNLPEYDSIIFDVLNPVTVDAMIRALDIIRPMLSRPADDDRYHRYKGMKISKASLERALKLYYLGIMKYLSGLLLKDPDTPLFTPRSEDFLPSEEDTQPWIDIAGQLVPKEKLTGIIESADPFEIDRIFRQIKKEYSKLQREWIDRRFPSHLRLDAEHIMRGAREFDRLVELDRETYRESLSNENAMLSLLQ